MIVAAMSRYVDLTGVRLSPSSLAALLLSTGYSAGASSETALMSLNAGKRSCTLAHFGCSAPVSSGGQQHVVMLKRPDLAGVMIYM